MIKKLLILSLLVSSLFAQVDLRTATLYKADINSQRAYNMQQKGALLVDIRTKREFADSHAKGSINIPLFYAKNGQRVVNQQFIIQMRELMQNKLEQNLILICRSGSRTKLGANVLAQNGFTNVFNIKEGFQYDWIKVNLPVEK